MRKKFHIVNLLLVFTLLIGVLLHFLIELDTYKQIKEYETTIAIKAVRIQILEDRTVAKDDSISLLRDSLLYYKNPPVMCVDTIINDRE